MTVAGALDRELAASYDITVRAGSADGDGLTTALAATKDFKGSAGNITIDAKHNATKKLVVMQIGSGGTLKWVYTYNPGQASGGTVAKPGAPGAPGAPGMPGAAKPGAPAAPSAPGAPAKPGAGGAPAPGAKPGTPGTKPAAPGGKPAAPGAKPPVPGGK